MTFRLRPQSVSANAVVSQEDLTNRLRSLAGHVLRAKGVVQVAANSWMTVQMVGERIDVVCSVRP